MDKPLQTFIFIGRPGCGKGTQADLLIAQLKEKGLVTDANPLFYLETGDEFRAFVAGLGYSSGLAKAIMDRSERQPDFLAVWIWSRLLVDKLTGSEHIILDGTPRSLLEAQTLDTALKFYGRVKPKVIYLDVSNDWSRARMAARGRADDAKAGDIEKRLAWFERDVRPAVEYYEKHPDYDFVRVNGEQTIEEVHAELMGKIGLE